MNKQINTYYIPNNPNIINDRIYTLYLTNNTNLDLSSIINNQNIELQQKETPKEKDTISITIETYNKLLELNKLSYQLITKRTKNTKNFINQDTTKITELSKINKEYQELLNKIIKERN